MHELGATSLGAAVITTGLCLISKSGGKKGNTAKGLLGLLLTVIGGYVMFKGPGYVRSKDKSLRFSTEGGKINVMIKLTERKAKEETDTIKSGGYNLLSALLTYLPSSAVPIPDHLNK